MKMNANGTNATAQDLCTCCGCEPVSEFARENGWEYCLACSVQPDCIRCGHLLDEQHYLWENAICRECQDAAVVLEQIISLTDRLEESAKAGGWSCKLEDAAWSGTCYYRLTRPVGDPAEGEEESLKVRIGDHPTAHCTEDYSLVPPGRQGGDDHNIEAVLAEIAKPRE
jgi:hypothetical protein